MPDPTDKKKKKVVRVKKKRNGETSVLRVDEKRAARNKKVQEAGVIDNKATSHVGIDKDGNYIAKKNTSLVASEKEINRKLVKYANMTDHPEAKKLRKQLRENKKKQALHKKSATTIADVGNYQKKGQDTKYGKKLLAQQNKSDKALMERKKKLKKK